MWAALSLYCTPWFWGVKDVSPKKSPLCLLFQNLWAKNVCSQFKEFSQTEPPSLSLKTKLWTSSHIYKKICFFLGQEGLDYLGNKWNCSEITSVFIYGSSFPRPKLWRFSVPDSCLGIPLPAIALGLARILGASVSNTLKVHLDMEGHCVSDTCPCLFLGWSLVVLRYTGEQAAGNTTNMTVMKRLSH